MVLNIWCKKKGIASSKRNILGEVMVPGLETAESWMEETFYLSPLSVMESHL